MEPAVQPVDIEVVRDTELRIRWTDASLTVIPLAQLRKACPCAGCAAERDQADRRALPIVQESAAQRAMTIVANAELVGRYALRLVWKDGHDAGIYDFGLLRSLSPVPCASLTPTAPRQE
jgi:DUF971 family protein